MPTKLTVTKKVKAKKIVKAESGTAESLIAKVPIFCDSYYQITNPTLKPGSAKNGDIVCHKTLNPNDVVSKDLVATHLSSMGDWLIQGFLVDLKTWGNSVDIKTCFMYCCERAGFKQSSMIYWRRIGGPYDKPKLIRLPLNKFHSTPVGLP